MYCTIYYILEYLARTVIGLLLQTMNGSCSLIQLCCNNNDCVASLALSIVLLKEPRLPFKGIKRILLNNNLCSFLHKECDSDTNRGIKQNMAEQPRIWELKASYYPV